MLPNRGIEEWDKLGEPAHDPIGLAAFLNEMRNVIRSPLQLTEIDAHINDQAFAEVVLETFDTL